MVFFYIRIVCTLYKSKKQVQKMLSTKDNDTKKQKNGNKQIGTINQAYRVDHETISSSNINLSIVSETQDERQPGKSTKNAHQISDTQLAAQNKQNAKHKRKTQTHYTNFRSHYISLFDLLVTILPVLAYPCILWMC